MCNGQLVPGETNKDNDTLSLKSPSTISRLLRLSPNGLAAPGLISLVSFCMREYGLHSGCSSAVPCVLPLSGALLCTCPVMHRGFQHFASKIQTVVPVELCCIHALLERPGGHPLPYSSLCRSSNLRYERRHFISMWLLMMPSLCTEGPYLLLSPCHVCGLFCIEWISDASHHKNIQLQLLFTVVFLPLQLLQILFLLAGGGRARAGRTGTAAAAAGRQSARALAGPARRDAGSGLRCHHLFALLLYYPIRFLLAGRWIQHLALEVMPT